MISIIQENESKETKAEAQIFFQSQANFESKDDKQMANA